MAWDFWKIHSGKKILMGGKCLFTGNPGVIHLGDNLYSSDPDRIEQGSRNGYTHGAIIKPNQAGTFTTVQKAIETLQRNGQRRYHIPPLDRY